MFEAVDTASHLRVAVKQYKKGALTSLHRRQVQREIVIHRRLHHRHIVELFSVFEDDTSVFLVLELCPAGMPRGALPQIRMSGTS